MDTLKEPAQVDVGENDEEEKVDIPEVTFEKLSSSAPAKAEEIAAEVVATEQTESLESMKSIEETFVKVDVNNNGDESPHIQMIEMPSGLTEEEKTEASTPTVEPAAAEENRPVDDVSNGIIANIPDEVSAPVLPEERKNGKAPVDTGEVAMAVYNPLLGRLEAMGFSDRQLNLELLKANAFDLRKSVDALCAVDDWAPAFEELEDMVSFSPLQSSSLCRHVNLEYVVTSPITLEAKTDIWYLLCVRVSPTLASTGVSCSRTRAI